jgi:hypothetical protein
VLRDSFVGASHKAWGVADWNNQKYNSSQYRIQRTHQMQKSFAQLSHNIFNPWNLYMKWNIRSQHFLTQYNGLATGCTSKGLGLNSLATARDFSSTQHLRSVLGFTKPLIQWALSLGTKWVLHEADHYLYLVLKLTFKLTGCWENNWYSWGFFPLSHYI